MKAIVSSTHYQGKLRLQRVADPFPHRSALWQPEIQCEHWSGRRCEMLFHLYVCVCVCLQRNVDNIFSCMGLKRHVYFQAIEFYWQRERQRQSNITWCFVEKLYFKWINNLQKPKIHLMWTFFLNTVLWRPQNQTGVLKGINNNNGLMACDQCAKGTITCPVFTALHVRVFVPSKPYPKYFAMYCYSTILFCSFFGAKTEIINYWGCQFND